MGECGTWTHQTLREVDYRRRSSLRSHQITNSRARRRRGRAAKIARSRNPILFAPGRSSPASDQKSVTAVVLCVDGTLFFERSVFVPRRTLVYACMHNVALDLNAGIRCVGVRVFSRIHGRAVRLFYKKWGYGSTTPPWPTQDFFYCEWVPDYRYHRITVFSHK